MQSTYIGHLGTCGSRGILRNILQNCVLIVSHFHERNEVLDSSTIIKTTIWYNTIHCEDLLIISMDSDTCHTPSRKSGGTSSNDWPEKKVSKLFLFVHSGISQQDLAWKGFSRMSDQYFTLISERDVWVICVHGCRWERVSPRKSLIEVTQIILPRSTCGRIPVRLWMLWFWSFDCRHCSSPYWLW